MSSTEKMKGLLSEAEGACCGDRNEHYGDPLVNHERTAALWVEFLKNRIQIKENNVSLTLDGRDVAVMNILQKISRECHLRKRDTLVDIAGYSANASLWS